MSKSSVSKICSQKNQSKNFVNANKKKLSDMFRISWYGCPKLEQTEKLCVKIDDSKLIEIFELPKKKLNFPVPFAEKIEKLPDGT